MIDSNSTDLSFSVEDAQNKINDNVKAIVAVHYLGQPADMKSIKKFAEKNNLYIIEDCAHCIGGKYDGKYLGTIGDLGCFSFEEKKGMTSGDGGMIVSNNIQLIEKLKPMRWVGIDKDTWKRKAEYVGIKNTESMHWHYEVSVLGYKFNMNNLAAAIGREQLKKLDSFNKARQAIIDNYLKHLNSRRCQPIIEYKHEDNCYWIFGLRAKNRDDLIAHLNQIILQLSTLYAALQASFV